MMKKEHESKKEMKAEHMGKGAMKHMGKKAGHFSANLGKNHKMGYAEGPGKK